MNHKDDQVSTDEVAQEDVARDRRAALAAERMLDLANSIDGAKFPRQEKALALAGLIANLDHDTRDFGSHDLNCALAAYAGRKIAAQVPALLAIHEHLKGYTAENRLDLGGSDNYAFQLFDGLQPIDEKRECEVNAVMAQLIKGYTKRAPQPKKLKVFGKALQNYNYLVALLEGADGWQVHIRRFWDDIFDKRAKGHYTSLDGLAAKLERGVATLQDVMEASSMMERYADSGNRYSSRPTLAQFADSGFAVRHPSSCDGLRMGDLRDAGYIASVSHDPLYGWTCDAPTAQWRLLTTTLFDLASTTDTMAELSSLGELA